jgi:hypothetical protein
VPDGAEAVSGLQTLARSYVTKGGQVTDSDAYFNLAGLTYSVNPSIGTLNTNYYSTGYGFDARGRQNMVKSPTGTISRTVYDVLNRTASSWVGTNDNGATDTDPTGGGATGNNMIKVSDNAYDTYTTPTAPTLTQTSGGTLAATTYYVKVTYLLNGAETPASPESSLAVSANFVLQVNSPASMTGATGYNVYVATANGKEVLQNGATPIALGTNWTEPATGLVTGTAAPFTNGVGDGNLTQTTQYPGGGATNRVTQSWYDWRDRLVASKSGVQGTEDTTTHRPISYTTYDNLNEATKVQSFDGDTVTLSYSSGVPQAPSASLLRAQTKTSYDDQGRVYLTQTYSVNPSTPALTCRAGRVYCMARQLRMPARSGATHGQAASTFPLRAATVRTGGKIQKLRPDTLTSFMPAPRNAAAYSRTCRMSSKATLPSGFSTRTISRIASRRPSTP